MGAPVHVAPGTLGGLTTTTRALGVSIDGYGLKANEAQTMSIEIRTVSFEII